MLLYSIFNGGLIYLALELDRSWTETDDHWGYAVVRASSDRLGDPKSATLRLTAERPTSSELAGVGTNRRKSASCDQTR